MRKSQRERKEVGDGRYRRQVERKDLKKRRKVCRDHTRRQFKVLTDRTAVDTPIKEKRFTVVYNRRSRKYSVRRRVKVEVGARSSTNSKTEPARPTVTDRFKGANWREREVWDMFGVGFEGHPDRRRILSDYGIEGHPRRKDFPLTGFKEVRYDEGRKRVVREPVERSQERR